MSSFSFSCDQHFKSVAEGQKSDTPPASRTATAELERLALDWALLHGLFSYILFCSVVSPPVVVVKLHSVMDLQFICLCLADFSIKKCISSNCRLSLKIIKSTPSVHCLFFSYSLHWVGLFYLKGKTRGHEFCHFNLTIRRFNLFITFLGDILLNNSRYCINIP